MPKYPKRLIEVDLPIKRISTHSRREKSIRHGHISTLHIWWARRPLAACRAVICASLWPDPADELCPEPFRKAVKAWVLNWSRDNIAQSSSESFADFAKFRANPAHADNLIALREALLHFIADFSDWDNSTNRAYINSARALTGAAFSSPGKPTRLPIVADPFAGGGSFPLEAARVGAEAFGSDINPVAVLLNKLIVELLPRYPNDLVTGVRKWGDWLIQDATKALKPYFHVRNNVGAPMVYMWARTVTCEGPGCGTQIPLMRSLWLSKNDKQFVYFSVTPDKGKKIVELDICESASSKSVGAGTVRRGSATCPICGYTTPEKAVKAQFQNRAGGAADSRLVAVVSHRPGSAGRYYRLPTAEDVEACKAANIAVKQFQGRVNELGDPLVPDEPLPYLRSIFNINLLGVHRWADLFSPRQLLTVLTLIESIQKVRKQADFPSGELGSAILLSLACAIDRHIDQQTTLVTWIPNIQAVSHTFVRQALGITWDFCEPNPIGDSGGSISGALEWVIKVLEQESAAQLTPGHIHLGSATRHPLPDDAVDVLATDPPYYDAVPYADLSDFFYVWLKRMLGQEFPALFEQSLTPKKGEIVQLAERNKDYAFKTKEYFEKEMTLALSEGRRIVAPDGLAVIVFAHKDTSAWETMLQSVIDAGWVVVASWPIDTERTVRLRAINSAALGSSIHLVCRPRESKTGAILRNEVGDWRDILQELPKRIGEWMVRLSAEGVVGADAIFACLGPALEIYSRYSRVEKANGDGVNLAEYLEAVWTTVSRIALSMIFEGVDATGFDRDSRITAMWLWTISTGVSSEVVSSEEDEVYDQEGDEVSVTTSSAGYELEFDAARKIAQGLGINLDDVKALVEVKGDKARLFSVWERAKYLFGKEDVTIEKKKKEKKPQLNLFDVVGAVPDEVLVKEFSTSRTGFTDLDRLHQAMILFAANRPEALKRLLVEEGVGKNPLFWILAQSLSALYPKGTDEKRWVDGVLARKKGLGF